MEYNKFRFCGYILWNKHVGNRHPDTIDRFECALRVVGPQRLAFDLAISNMSVEPAFRCNRSSLAGSNSSCVLPDVKEYLMDFDRADTYSFVPGGTRPNRQERLMTGKSLE